MNARDQEIRSKAGARGEAGPSHLVVKLPDSKRYLDGMLLGITLPCLPLEESSLTKQRSMELGKVCLFLLRASLV